MKFRTADLITRIDAVIEQRKQDAEIKYAEDVAKVAAEREQWLTDRGEAWTLFANRVKDKIRKGRPIALADVPKELRGRYREIDFFQESDRPTKQEPRVADLLTLKATLQAVTDETITTTGLREIGFKDIARLFAGGAR